ncbi:MAG: MFS transporter [Clostridia bacterium]|nr:MFS transporter [Clostridia bacterium]
MKDSTKTTRVAYIIEAGFEHFISLFVTGTLLGYILDILGFSDAQQGVISTVATFTCGAQLFALVLTGRRRKRLVTVGHLINQGCFVLLYLLPIFDLAPAVKSACLLLLLFSGHIINNAINPTKITWLMGSVPNESRGRFTAIKEMISLAGGIAVSLGFGAVADTFRSADGMPTRPYYIICTAALALMMLIHTVTLLISTEHPDASTVRTPIGQTVTRMIRNRELVKVIGVGMIWNIASALSTSFYASYLRQELAFSFTLIALLSTAGSVCRIALSPLLGKIADKHSFSTSMTLAFAFAAAAFFAMSFTSPQTKWLYLVYVCLHAFAMAGINSGVINLIYDYVAPADRAVAMGFKNALGGILAFFTALASSFVLGAIQKAGGVVLFGYTLYAQQVLAFASCVAVLLLILYMRRVIAPLHRVDK